MEVSFVKYLGRKIKCRCGKMHFVPTREILVGKNGPRYLLNVIRRLKLGKRVLVVADKNTFAVAGESISEYLAENGFSVGMEVYCPPGRKKLKAERALADRLAKGMTGNFDFAVAVGSGTINDITKYAATRVGIPYIAYATAPSMNGYPSSIAALYYKGTKKTIDANPPVAVIGDVDILCSAPIEMILAGMGDGISKSVCNIDWAIAHLVKGDYFCPLPGRLMAKVMDFYLRCAPGLKARSRTAIRELFEALNIAGISMVIAGSSAPASGGEHLISHFFDMFNSRRGKEPNLHGQQVGVATIISARLYEYLLKMDIRKVDVKGLKAGYLKRRWTRKYFLNLYGKAMSEEVRKEFMKKYLPWKEKEREIRLIVRNWGKIKGIIKKMLVPSEKLVRVLRRTGAPVSFSQLGISRKELKKVILHAREIRSRYTVLDLACDLGVLEDFSRELL